MGTRAAQPLFVVGLIRTCCWRRGRARSRHNGQACSRGRDKESVREAGSHERQTTHGRPPRMGRHRACCGHARFATSSKCLNPEFGGLCRRDRRVRSMFHASESVSNSRLTRLTKLAAPASGSGGCGASRDGCGTEGLPEGYFCVTRAFGVARGRSDPIERTDPSSKAPTAGVAFPKHQGAAECLFECRQDCRASELSA